MSITWKKAFRKLAGEVEDNTRLPLAIIEGIELDVEADSELLKAALVAMDKNFCPLSHDEDFECHHGYSPTRFKWFDEITCPANCRENWLRSKQ